MTDNAITVGSLSIGRTYTIKTVGSTDFTVIGASASTIGVTFTATGAGSGTGTVTNTKTLKYDYRVATKAIVRLLLCQKTL